MKKILPFLMLTSVTGCNSFQNLTKEGSKVSIRQYKETSSKIKQQEAKLINQQSKEKKDIVTHGEYDANGEVMSLVDLEEVIIEAKSVTVAERRGKIKVDFVCRIPHNLIGDDWQLCIAPNVYTSDSIYQSLERMYVTGKNFDKRRNKQYSMFNEYMNSIKDSINFFSKEKYEKYISDKKKELHNNYEEYEKYKRERQKAYDTFRNSPSIFNPFGVTRDSVVLPAKWVSFSNVADIAYYFNKQDDVISNEAISVATDVNGLRKNAEKKKNVNNYFEEVVSLKRDECRIDSVVDANNLFTFHYKQDIDVSESFGGKTLYLIADVKAINKDRSTIHLGGTDTITFRITGMNQLIDRTPMYRKEIKLRKAEQKKNIRIEYDVASSVILPTPKNSSELDSLKKTIYALSLEDEYLIEGISMVSYSSPEGSFELNKKLSNLRSNEFQKLLMREIAENDLSCHVQINEGGENWEELYIMFPEVANLKHIDDPDRREGQMKKLANYVTIKDSFPQLRRTELTFNLSRKNMVKDTIVTDVIDDRYLEAVSLFEKRQYSSALAILQDYTCTNTALVYMTLGYDQRAGEMLERLPATALNDYLKAILYSRLGKDRLAVESLLAACKEDDSFIYRGLLDPEINVLIQTNNLFAGEY